MLIVAVKDNESIDKALKKFKKKFERTGVVRELRDRKNFEKPSVTRRQENKSSRLVGPVPPACPPTTSSPDRRAGAQRGR